MGLTDKASQADDFNNTREAELKRLKHTVMGLTESYNRDTRSHFTDHVISSNELSTHYIGFPSVDILNAALNI